MNERRKKERKKERKRQGETDRKKERKKLTILYHFPDTFSFSKLVTSLLTGLW
jgi:hypothetical protein